MLQTKSIADENFQTPQGKKAFKKAVFSCWLGTAMEYADFALYGLAAATVFSEVFFPEQTPVIALLLSFVTYGIGFIARPIGALFFGYLGDKYGRKNVLMSTIALMGISTTLIGFIPSYAVIGIWAPICLVILRFMQGFGAGAELSGGTVMLGEYAPSKHRGLISSIIALGSNSGTLLAAFVWLLVTSMDDASFKEWGWRIPFIGSIFIALFAVYMRLNVKETPVFEKQKELMLKIRHKNEAHMKKDERTFWQKSRAFWTMVGIRIGENGPSYLAQGFIVGYVTKILLLDKSVATTAVVIASLVGFLVIPLAGYLSDKFGRRITYRTFCLLLMLYAFPAFMLLDSKNEIIVILTIIVGMSLASLGIFGVQAAWGVELFGAKNRYTKMALAKEFGSILSGGTAPMIASALLAYYGAWWPIALYFVVTAGIGFITTFFAPETRGRDLNLIEDAI
ncbi:MFS transporter [Campylobacter lari]|uniref:MFS transporter n=1 Tax=Campylobacter lari TaxID=201 RepID=UPI00156FECC1|nr:MFS transporter [Campylobacter lari]EHJ5166040.1 MHS family MFS transporter [Campylobacter lari]MCW0196438.1 MHS family MFS transporter [Campylobacter lari]MCW0238148.1 MHS family MFS transporter [Campylobacter lari]MCW0262665.1 MHS family MFS transporter [Campylobacter lari]HDV6340247.1 MHS family MFS transporter [Campylobacter lari]